MESRGDGSKLLFGDAVVQGGLDGVPSVPDSCRWVVRVVVEVFDDFSGVVARSSSGLEDEWDQVDAVIPVEFVLFFAFGHVAWTTTGGRYEARIGGKGSVCCHAGRRRYPCVLRLSVQAGWVVRALGWIVRCMPLCLCAW